MDNNREKKEKCVLCGKNTNVNIGENISLRKYYIECSGQLCEKCFKEIYHKP